MAKAKTTLRPPLLWKHFMELCRIPHGSGNEAAAAAYIIDAAKAGGYEWKQDRAGNVLVRKPAQGVKGKPPVVILQGHIDMVCEKNSDVKFDFTRDAIQTVIRKEKDGEYMYAKGTTLGADNGIGVAAALAILEDKRMVHPPLELLFTVDEETGLTGAMALSKSLLKGRILLNLDTEEDDSLCIGCAGGGDTNASLRLIRVKPPRGAAPVQVTIRGLRGGHSGCDIHEQRGNAVKILGRLLYEASRTVDFHLLSIDGGDKHNAIPREAGAVVYVGKEEMPDLKRQITALGRAIKVEIKAVDSGLKIAVEPGRRTRDAKVLAPASRDKVLGLLMALPHGVLGMSFAMENLVETSTNLAAVKTEGSRLAILMSSRSSTASRLDETRSRLRAIFDAYGAASKEEDAYPGWQPNPDSRVLKVMEKVYKRLYKEDPKIEAIHAGLECGLISAKYSGMDMVSFGPLIQNPHSPDERVKIKTVEKFWKILKEALQELAAAKR